MDAWRIPDVDTLPLTTEQWLDEVCVRFEASWATASCPSIESYLAESSGIDRLALLRELVLMDISWRVAANDSPHSQEYLDRFSELDPAWLEEQIDLASATGIFSELSKTNRSVNDLSKFSCEQRSIDSFKDYEQLELVGGGGMGVVYRARQRSAKRTVALKMIRSGQFASTREMQRFWAEVEAAAQLDHPNIVSLYEAGEHHGQPYFSMKYVDGPSLAAALASGEWAARTKGMQGASVRLLATLARAVHHAHQRGVLHRDLKPANILLEWQMNSSWEFSPMIADFGLARQLTSNSATTTTGDVVGTPSYMSPEQALSRKDLSTAVDVYGLGAIFYELLTGEPPFRSGSALETMQRVIAEEVRRPSTVSPGVDLDLETISLRCLQKEPNERYPSALALAEDLERWLAGEPITARRRSRWERAWRWCRRNPGWAAMTTVVAILLLTISVGGLVLNVELRNAVEQSEKGRKELEVAERARREQLLESHEAEAQAKRFSRRAGQRFGTLEAIAHAAKLARELDQPTDRFDKLRNLAIAAMALPDFRDERDLSIAPSDAVDLAFDDRLELYARGDADGLVTVRRIADDKEVAHWRGSPSRTTVDFGRDDGNPFLLIRNGASQSLLVWRFGRSDPIPVGSIDSKDSNGLSLTADNQLLAFVDADGSMPVFEFPSGKLLRRIHFRKWHRRPAAPIPTYISVHPFDHRVAIAVRPENDLDDNVVRVIDLDNGEVVDFAPAPASPVFSVNWHADGKLLVVGQAMEVVFWDVATHRIVRRLSDRKEEAVSVRINSTGDGMTTRSQWGGGLKYWHPFALKPQLLVPDFNGEVSTTADGQFVCSTRQGDRLNISTIAPSREMRTFAVRPKDKPIGELRGLACHPAGRLLALGSDSGVFLFDLETGFEVGHLDIGHNWGVHFVADTGELLTYGIRGMHRWPVQPAQEGSAKLRIGPPTALPIRKPNYDCFVAASRDGSAIAAGVTNGATVIRRGQPDKVIPLAPVEEVRQQISISADGRWVATGVHLTRGDTRIWDGATGKLVKEMGIGSGYALNFSPDGQWLYVDYRMFRTGTWEEQKRELRPVYRFCAFSPDSRLLATDRGNGAIRLEQVGTWKELAYLENPSQGRCAYFCFTGDGTKLIALNVDDQVVQVWDLRLIRENLSNLELDWHEPPYPAVEKKLDGKKNRPLELEIVGVELI